MQLDEIFSEASSRKYRELRGGPEGVVSQQSNFLQRVNHEASVESGVRKSTQEIVQDIFRRREEMTRFKLTLKQAFVTIDENCGRQAQALTGFETFAGSQLGANERFRETLGQSQGQSWNGPRSKSRLANAITGGGFLKLNYQSATIHPYR